MPVLEHFTTGRPRPHPRRADRAARAGRAPDRRPVRVILVCGGLADGVTELVCARLQHSGYPYRLLDLAHYPGRLPRRLALDRRRALRHHRRPRLGPRSRRDHRRLRPLPRTRGPPAAATAIPRRRGAAARGGCRADGAPRGPALPGGQPHRRRHVEQQQALPGAAAPPRGPPGAGDAGHQRPRRRPRLPGRARRRDLQVGQRHPLDRPPPRPRPARSPRLPARRPGPVPGLRSRPQRARAHGRRRGLRHPDRDRGGGLPLRPSRRARRRDEAP